MGNFNGNFLLLLKQSKLSRACLPQIQPKTFFNNFFNCWICLRSSSNFLRVFFEFITALATALHALPAILPRAESPANSKMISKNAVLISQMELYEDYEFFTSTCVSHSCFVKAFIEIWRRFFLSFIPLFPPILRFLIFSNPFFFFVFFHTTHFHFLFGFHYSCQTPNGSFFP